MDCDALRGIFAKILSGKCFTLVALQISGFSHGDGGKDRKKDTFARNLTIVVKGFRERFV